MPTGFKGRSYYYVLQGGVFTTTLDRLDTDLDYFYALRVSLTADSSSIGQSSTSEPFTTVKSIKPRIQLPAIELPKFDESFGKWETFRDRFTSLIVSDKSLSNFERMDYLWSALAREALESISNLNVTEANFEIAWKLIKNQYENERRIIMEHLRTLISVLVVRSNSAKSIRSLRDTIIRNSSIA